MNISYERQINRSYMHLTGECESPGFEEMMLRDNDIRILLSFYTIETENKTRFVYEITGKQSLRDYISREGLNVELFCRLIRRLGILFDDLGRYLISTEHLYLTPDTMFVEREAEGFCLKACYYPGPDMNVQEQIQKVLEYLISVIDARDGDLKKFAYRVYELSCGSDFTFGKLSEAVREFEEQQIKEEDEILVEQVVLTPEEPLTSEEKAPDEKHEEKKMSFSVFDEEEEEEEGFLSSLFGRIRGFFRKNGKKVQEKSPVRLPGREKEEDFIIDPSDRIDEPTVLLSVSNQKCVGKLLYEGRGEETDHEISRDVFRIGTRQSDNDAVLHSSGVSRHHARIIREGEKYFLEDLNSTNGTYVNGEILKYKERLPLNAMDQIQFADVPYRIV